VWDLFAAHQSVVVQELAQELGLRLELIPGKMTTQLQPLDCRIFGNLNSLARRRLHEWRHDPEFDTQGSIQILVHAWRSISQDEIMDAWRFAQE
jgi:hypothetical protein